MPLYLKTNSYGEFIFDWGWANAASRAGVRYYPKLVAAIPFTPATGRRLCVLAAPDVDAAAVDAALLDGVRGGRRRRARLVDSLPVLHRARKAKRWRRTGYFPG